MSNLYEKYMIYLHNKILGSHTKHNPIHNNIEVCTKTKLGLDYNSLWGEASFPRKVPHSGTRVYEWSRHAWRIVMIEIGLGLAVLQAEPSH
jgi:hypothetical protein